MSQMTTAIDDNDAGQRASDRFSAMAQRTIDRVAASRAGRDGSEAATGAAEIAEELQEHAVAAGGNHLPKVRTYVERNPLTALGIAVGIGALLTAIARR